MAQTLIAFYCFNDGSESAVKDFSTNERHSSSVSGLTINQYDNSVGYTCKFNGTSSYANFGNITAFNSLAAFTIVTKINLTTLGVKQVISHMEFNHTLEITAADTVKFTLDTGAAVAITNTTILSKNV